MKRILLIAGHGAGDPGATATIDGKYYKEAELTRQLVAKIRTELSNYEVTADTYDTARNAFADAKSGSFSSRAKLNACDYVLEVHFNAAAGDPTGNGRTTGTEIYYPSRGGKSGCDGAICSAIEAAGFKNRGVKVGQFLVINNSYLAGVKANLLEVCFIDDADDMRLYLQNKDKIAQGIGAAIAGAMGLVKKAESKAETREDEDMKRYKSLEEIPESYRESVGELISTGVLAGKGAPAGLDLSEDMIRCMIINMRYCKKMKEEMKNE